MNKVIKGVIGLSVIVIICWGAISQNSPAPKKSEYQNARSKEHEEATSKPKQPSYLSFITGLEKVSKYCAGRADTEPDKWLQEKFICDIHATDVVVAVFTVLLAFLTGILGLIALWQILTTRRQLRAYLFPEAVALVDGMQLQPPQPARANVPGIVIALKNSGQTPAYDLVSWAGIDVRDVNSLSENGLTIPSLQNISVGALGANAGSTKSLWFHRAITPQEITEIGQGVKAIYVYGTVQYKSFGRRRRTDFRLRYNGIYPPLANPVFNWCDSGNSAT